MYRQSSNAQIPEKSSWKSLSPNLADPFLRKRTSARHQAWVVVNRSHLPALHRRPPAVGWPCSHPRPSGGRPVILQASNPQRTCQRHNGGEMRISRRTGSFEAFWDSLGEICPEIGSNNHQHPPTNHWLHPNGRTAKQGKKHFFTIYTNAVTCALFYKALEDFFKPPKNPEISNHLKPPL